MTSHSFNTDFTTSLLRWFDEKGRKNLPWQYPGTPYQVWISEIMLQQTQVKTVIPYFERFMSRFPTLTDLALAPEDEVFALWAGLGYYSRARHLHRTAQIIYHDYQGEWPTTLEGLLTLPGIGQSTAAAILSQAFHQATAILDGNVKRVLCRYFMIEGYPEQSVIQKRLWELANACMSKDRCKDYTQAIMDLGALCCTNRNPQCSDCPVKTHCAAFKNDRVNDFPFKKTRKIIPTKEQQFLLIYNQVGQIYLEKNPPSGIWGSLWSLPAIDMLTDPVDYLNAWPMTNEYFSLNEFIQLKHTFTHFHLHMQSHLIQIDSISTPIRPNSSGEWFNASNIQTIGLPKPIKTIIDTFLDRRINA